jgi:hypothetical protein
VTGILRLDVEPADIAQVFVDGEFVGTPHDTGGELELTPGRRQVEIRAPGYETLVFDVRIVAGRTITYRETLNRPVPPGGTGGPGSENKAGGKPDAVPTSPAGSTSPTPPKTTFYLIPGCYLGNVHPDQIKLPAGCDLSRMITHTP